MTQEKTALKRAFNANPFYMVPVEIIVPFYNEHARVTSLISDIFGTVQSNRYMLTLVDDGSENKNFVSQINEKKLSGVRVLRQPTRKGFAAAVNLALATPPEADIPFVCVIQSDVRLKDSAWLLNLGKSLCEMKAKNVKMVCPTTNNPMTDNEALIAPKLQNDPDNELKGFIPMYCFLANRELFKRLGPLEEFPYAGCEAEEYASRMEKAGFKQGVCGSSWVHHEGGCTLANLRSDRKAQEILRKAREEFELRGKKDTNEDKKDGE
jgi:GT2 family glycosyltransferase